ncbi:MAG: hypothetical protein QG608_2221 [Actinomycetota bacterium]|nr:hypothetical protein [Actinomycetota bacterium]
MEYVDGVAAAGCYAAVGFVLLGLGFLLVDLLTPGRLGKQIWEEKNVNASIVLSSGLLGTGIVITTAVLTSEGNLADGLVSTAVYGLIGLALMGISFLLMDLATPGKLGETLTEPTVHPAAFVTGTVHVVIGMIMAACIS